ncbi:MAG TPA: deoxynucleoside kinase, partial [Anaerolineae bacterium]|nr:deoxynucleoside kinase [Anaerolineae bacterium]
MPRFPFIAIEGVIGVGKTTLARMLTPDFGGDSLLEVFEENPFLSDFYADRERYAFQTQIFFLLSRYRQQHQAVPNALKRGALFSDYTFAKDSLFAHLNLSGDELVVYEKLHSALAEKIPAPDLLIYLRADLDTLMTRIAMRDRPYERGMDRSYIDSLRLAYEGFFTAYNSSPVLVIDTNSLNIVAKHEAYFNVRERIRSALGEGTFQPSLPQMPITAGIESTRAVKIHKSTASSNPLQEFASLTQSIGNLGAVLSDGADASVLQESLQTILKRV